MIQREILFRGKRIDNGDLIHGDYCYFGDDDTHCISKWESICTDYETGYSELKMSWIQIIPETVGQFTGLTDKNGVKIFDGDIYTQGDNNIRYEVVWHDSGFKGNQLGNKSYAGLEHWIIRIEVIGNIHETNNTL